MLDMVEFTMTVIFYCGVLAYLSLIVMEWLHRMFEGLEYCLLGSSLYEIPRPALVFQGGRYLGVTYYG